MNKQIFDMTRGELINLVTRMGWYALDLAQDLALTRYAKPEYMPEMVDRACQMAYNLTHFWDIDFVISRVNLVKVGDNGVESSYELTNGVKLTDNDGNLRSLSDILFDVGKKWDE